MKVLKLMFAALLLATMGLLVVQNFGIVELRFAVWKVALPLALPAVVAYFLGAWTGRPLYRFFRSERREIARDRRIDREVRRRVDLRDRRAT